MKKRMIYHILLACLLVGVLAPAANAATASGTCGDGLTWTLDNYTLTISGSGEMEDGCPWEAYMTKVEHVVLTGGVTKVGAGAFSGFDRLETVDFGDALVEIGEKAFYGCEDIEYIHLPKTFRTFGAGCFRDCISLKYVYCDGGMPRFNDSCLWTGNYISVFYPTDYPWPQEAVSQLINNFGGRLGIMMGNFDAENLPGGDDAKKTEKTEETEPTEEATEETTEATVEAVVAAVTEAATEPATVPTTAPTEPEPTETTVPETEENTVPTTEAEETTQPPETTRETEPQTVAQKVGGDGWIGMVMIAGVLTFLLAGAMIFRSVTHKGGRYRE